MKLTLTPEQIEAIKSIAPKDAKAFTIDPNFTISFFSDTPFRRDGGSRCYWVGDDCREEIENWRELCFEVKDEK